MTTALQSATAQLAREQAKAKREALSALMWQHIMAAKLHASCAKEHVFHETRKWRFDFAWPLRKVALEVDGGVHTGGRHTRGAGYTEDCVKINTAVIQGWRVLRATGEQVKSGQALQWLEALLLPKPVVSVLAGIEDAVGGKLAYGKTKAVRSEKYRRLVAAMPCANCGIAGYSQHAHANQGKGGGLKTDDNKGFPLCTVHPDADGHLVQGCHERFDQGAMYAKQQRRDLEVKWGSNTAAAIRRQGKWPLNLPYPRFEDEA